jgi:NADPH2:quinone reductase
MERMRAWVLERHGKADSAFVLKELERPVPGEGQVLIEVQASGLNFADVMARKGLYPDCPPLPAIVGYDVVGRVAAHGPNTPADTPAIGTQVVALTRFGGYAEWACTDARAVLPLAPENELQSPVDLVASTALATQYGTAWQAAMECANLKAGEQVLIHAAAGGVGTALVQMALQRGCILFGSAGSAAKREALQAAGVQHPIDYRKNDWAETVRRLAGERGIDVVFDAIGGKTFRQGKALLAPGGRMVSFGAASLSDAPNPLIRMLRGLAFGFYHPVQWLSPSQSLIGINMLRLADHRPERLAECLQGVGRGYAEGWLKPQCGGAFPAEKLAEAQDLLEHRGSTGKLGLVW